MNYEEDVAQPQQRLEKEASRLLAEGFIEASLEKVWETLRQYPRSPVSSLGFKISRQLGRLQTADELKSFLVEKDVYNDQAKLDWASVYCEIADAELVRQTIDELLDNSKPLNWRLHALKTLNARRLARRSEHLQHETDPTPPIGVPSDILYDPQSDDRESFMNSETSDALGPSQFEELEPNLDQIQPDSAELSVSATEEEIDSPPHVEPSQTSGEDIKQAMSEVRSLGVRRDFAGLVEHYSKTRGQIYRDDLLVVYTKSAAKCAEDCPEGASRTSHGLMCVQFAEFVFGDQLALGAPLTGHHLVPMIEVHANAGLGRSAWKYLNWCISRGLEINFKHHIWPIMRMLVRNNDANSIVALARDCEAGGLHIDSHGASLIGRALVRLGRPIDAKQILTETASRNLEIDTHVLMAGLEIFAALRDPSGSTEWLLKCRDAMSPARPDRPCYGLAISTVFSAERFSEVVRLYELSESDGVVDDLTPTQYAIAKAALGDSRQLLELSVTLSKSGASPSACNELLNCKFAKTDLSLYRTICESIVALARNSDPGARLPYLQLLERHSLSRGRDLSIDQIRMIKNSILEIDPNSVIGLLLVPTDVGNPLADLKVVKEELQTSGLRLAPDAKLREFLQAASAGGAMEIVNVILDEFVQRGRLSTRHLALVMDSLIHRRMPASMVECVLNERLQYCIGFGPEQERILFNLLIKAHRREGAESEMRRVFGLMQSKGIEPDPYTLRELNQYSRNTPSQVGRRLDAGQSFQFGALTTILDDLRHELSHFVGKISLRLQTIGDLADEMNLQAIQEQSGAALHLAQEFSQRISEYSEVADPSSSGASSLKSGLDGLQKRFATDLKQLGIDFRVNGFEGYHNVFVNLSQWQLSAVLDGLVSNSVNALREWDGPRNIRVLVVIPKDPQPGEIVAITISDSGPGISPEIEEQIFDKGFTSRRSRGFGLGLAVVRGIVHGSGGYIQYNPNRNLNQTGAEFLVQLLIGESE